MSAFAQTTTGDLDLSSGNLVVVTDLTTEVAAKLTNLFSFFKGEWFIDTRLGVPYLQYVFVQNPDLTLIGAIFQRVALACPGVAAVTNMALNYYANLRNLVATLTIKLDNGAVLVGGPGQPFLISTAAP